MLKLTIYSNGSTDGYQVLFKKGTTINLESYNPMFNDVGTFSYLITVYRDENEHVFNHIAALDNVKTTALTFKLEVGTDVFAEGDIKVTDFDDDSIEFYLKSGYSSASYFLKNNYMCETDMWGQYDGDYGNNVAVEAPGTLEGCYPEYPIVYPLIAVDDVVENEGVYDSDEESTDLHPAIYVRYLIKQILAYLGYTKVSDALENIDDLNRLALFAATKYIGDISSHIRLSLPYITIADFLTDLRERFNIAIYFSPYLYQAEVLNIADTLEQDPVDWTDKFQSINSAEVVEEKELDFTQSAEEDTDLYTADDIADEYSITSVADVDALDNDSHGDESVIYIKSVDRYVQYSEVDEDNSLTLQNNDDVSHNCFRSSTEELNDDDYYTMQDKYKEDTSVQIANSTTTANTLNFIAQFLFPEWDGSVKSNIYISAYFMASAAAYLVTEIYAITVEDEDDVTDDNANLETLVGYDKRLLSKSNTYKEIDFKTLICTDEFDISEDVRLAIRFYCYAETAGTTITIQFGGYEDYDGYNTLYESYADIDYPYVTYKEIGALADVQIGDNDDSTTEFNPSSKIPLNALYPSEGYLFEMPVSSLSITRAKSQTDFEYLMYRGKRYDVQQGTEAAGYCNYDVLDIFKESYTDKLVTEVEPTLSLAWKGESGLLKKMWKNRLVWERYFKREVELNMDLTINDIINHKIYKPFMVDGIRYVIDKLSFDIDENADISNVVITAYTL